MDPLAMDPFLEDRLPGDDQRPIYGQLRPIQVLVHRIVVLDREPMSGCPALTHIKIESERNDDALSPLCERVRERVGRAVRAGVDSSDLTPILENAPYGKTRPVCYGVGAPDAEVDFVTEAVLACPRSQYQGL